MKRNVHPICNVDFFEDKKKKAIPFPMDGFLWRVIKAGAFLFGESLTTS
jgi:hypothetical protein